MNGSTTGTTPDSATQAPLSQPFGPETVEQQKLLAGQAHEKVRSLLADEDAFRAQVEAANTDMEQIHPFEEAEVTDEEMDTMFSGVGNS